MQIVLKGKQVTIFISKKFNCKENPWGRGSVEQERERSRHDKSVNPSEKNVENFCGYAPSNRDEKNATQNLIEMKGETETYIFG